MREMGMTKEYVIMGMVGMVMGYKDRMIKEWACMDVQANKGMIS